MKNKYQRLSREDKKECQKMYYSTPKGKDMRIRLTRITITGIIGILFAIYLLGDGILSQEMYWYNYVIIILLFLSSIIFLVGVFLLRKKVLNQFAIKIPRFKNK